jgi:hypothetical protein
VHEDFRLQSQDKSRIRQYHYCQIRIDAIEEVTTLHSLVLGIIVAKFEKPLKEEIAVPFGYC